MNPKQKVILTQLQIAGAGVLICIFGLIWKQMLLAGFGGLIILYGLIRAWMLSKLMGEMKDPQDWDESLDDIIEEAKEKEKREHPERADEEDD